MKSIKTRLAVMNFLEFAVWGAYLICMGNYLGNAGMGDYIGTFYAIQGIVSIFMPAIMGIVADKLMQPQRVLGLCHLLAGLFMGACWYLGTQSPTPDTMTFIACYSVSVAFFMPTIALANTVAFRNLNDAGLDTIKDFPPIRVLGTVGFIASMWFVNCAYISDGSFGFSLSNPLGEASKFDPRFQFTYWQFCVSAVLSLLLAVYTLTLPQCKLIKGGSKKSSIVEALGLNAFALFKQRKLAIFFIFSMLLGMCLQVTNGYATPFLNHFNNVKEFANTFASQNPTLLTSLSQMSEALCILMIPFFLRRFGIKKVMFISMMAWVFRFGCLGLGNPGSGLWLLIISMIVYGVAFDFFNVSGALFIERETDKSMQASAQGLFMLMTNGLGATIGMYAADAIVKVFTFEEKVGVAPDQVTYRMGDWSSAWFIFAGFALIVGILFMLLFKYKHNPNADEAKRVTAETEAAPDGFVEM